MDRPDDRRGAPLHPEPVVHGQTPQLQKAELGGEEAAQEPAPATRGVGIAQGLLSREFIGG